MPPALLALLLWAGCGLPVQEERGESEVRRVPVDSLQLYPLGLRYLAPGAEMQVRLSGIQKGYACAPYLRFELIRELSASRLRIHPEIDISLPSLPECPVSAGSDSLVEVSLAGVGAETVVLLNTQGAVTDSAEILDLPQATWHFRFLPGAEGRDTLHVAGPAGPDTIDYREVAGMPQVSFKMPVCDSLNFARHRDLGDTMLVEVGVVGFAERADFPARCRESVSRLVLPRPAIPGF